MENPGIRAAAKTRALDLIVSRKKKKITTRINRTLICTYFRAADETGALPCRSESYTAQTLRRRSPASYAQDLPGPYHPELCPESPGVAVPDALPELKLKMAVSL
jgi:hypothetical protein